MTEHTKGPWNVEKPYGESGVYVSGPTTALVCKLYPVDHNTFNVDKRVTIEANAALIAAAPDLLGALLAVVALAERGHQIDAMESDPTYVRARAALAKAQGVSL
jgi:hypothetical protein